MGNAYLVAAVKQVPNVLPTGVHRRWRMNESGCPGDEAGFILCTRAARVPTRDGAFLLLAQRLDVRSVAQRGQALPRALHGAERRVRERCELARKQTNT